MDAGTEAVIGEMIRTQVAVATQSLREEVTKNSADITNLDRDLFGNRSRPGDIGAIGEQRRMIEDVRKEWRQLKLWVQGLIASLMVSLVGSLIYILAAMHH